MGFYLRKSVRVGPFRFNLSNSGVGVSTGIKGFRVGTGPRGNYVHMGAGGLYFRSSLPSSRRASSSTHPESSLASESPEIQIESGSVERMVDSSSSELLQEINTKLRKVSLWPFVLGVTCLILFVFPLVGVQPWMTAALLLFGTILTFAAFQYDQVRKCVVLFYEMEPEMESAFQQLYASFDALSRCGSVWLVESSRAVNDRKRNAGAGNLVKRKLIHTSIGAPPFFKTNIAVPILPAGRQTLFFFPDRVLVYDGNTAGAVAYEHLQVTSDTTRFIEESSVPGDARIVDRTWRYVNKSGGPDKRFNNNRELPVVLYEELRLRSFSGLNELYNVSRIGVTDGIQRATDCMISALAMLSGRSKLANEAAKQFLKCNCFNCQNSIEFPVHGVGEEIACPHCGHSVILQGERIDQMIE